MKGSRKNEKFKARLFGMLLSRHCFGMLPVQADTISDNFVTREQAVVSILNTVGYGALDQTENNLSTFADAASVTAQYTDVGTVTNGIMAGSGTTIPRNVTRQICYVSEPIYKELPDLTKPRFLVMFHICGRRCQQTCRAGLFCGYGNGLSVQMIISPKIS